VLINPKFGFVTTPRQEITLVKSLIENTFGSWVRRSANPEGRNCPRVKPRARSCPSGLRKQNQNSWPELQIRCDRAGADVAAAKEVLKKKGLGGLPA